MLLSVDAFVPIVVILTFILLQTFDFAPLVGISWLQSFLSIDCNRRPAFHEPFPIAAFVGAAKE